MGIGVNGIEEDVKSEEDDMESLRNGFRLVVGLC